MKHDERSKLEERIIAYFDGSLDGEGSRSLLREVAESPEKRSLFKAHETLSRLIAAARDPMEAPLEVKRSVAEKIPGLLAFLPSLFGAAETAPILTENSNPFIAFFARMSFSTAAAIGGAVAVLLTTGIFIKNNVDRNAPVSSSPQAGMVQERAPMTSSNSFTRTQARTNADQPAATSRDLNHFISSTTANGVAKSNNSKGLSEAHNSGRLADLALSPEAQLGAQADAPLIANVTSPMPAASISASGNSIHNASTIPLNELPIVASEGVAVRTFATAGERLVYLNGVGGPGSVKPSASELVGMEFDLGDRYMFRVELGQTGFAQVTNQQVGMIGSQALIATNVVAVQKTWSTVGMSYSFTNLKVAPIILSGDVGAVWFNAPAMLARAGIATEIPLFGNLALRPSLTYDWVWTNSLPMPAQDGVYQNPINQNSMWSSAVGFNLGFVFQY